MPADLMDVEEPASREVGPELRPVSTLMSAAFNPVLHAEWHCRA